MTDGDLHDALRMGLLALALAVRAAEARLTPEQVRELNGRLAAGTGKLALFVTNDGVQAHAELALVDAGAGSVFSQSLLTLDGPLAAVVAPKGTARVVNGGAMN